MASFTTITFKTYDGLTLVADLYSAGDQKPCIIMSNGFSGLRTHFLPDFATRFQSAGYTVLVYDNRCWGDSEGTPRNQVDPALQTRDFLDAFNFACDLRDVDPTKIAYWGTSLSGGNAICAAAINKSIKAVIAQVPFTSGELISGNAPTDMLIGERAKAIVEGSPIQVPILPSSKEDLLSGTCQAVLKDGNGLKFADELDRRGLAWEKTVTVQSLTYTALHEPGAYIHRVSPASLLMIVASQDITTKAVKQLAAYESALEPKRLHIFHGAGHFDLYYGQHFEENVKIQLSFLNNVLA